MGLASSRQEAFWEACGFGNLERAKHFLEEGDIDVNWVSYTNDCCPIHVASQGKPEIVDLLLQHNCDVNVRDLRGNLPLHHAAMKGHADIIKTLIDAGSDINAQEKNGWTPLHNAAYWCHPEVVRVLIKNGCDVNIQNKDERTALHECARSQVRDDPKLCLIATMLIDAGSDINAKSSDLGEADLTGLMYASFHNHPEVATALITAGCRLDDVGTTFWSALHWAADRGHDELVYILLEAGANPTLRDMRGETARDRAQTEEIQGVLDTAVELYKEVHKVTTVPLKSAYTERKPLPTFKPMCNANFKSESFLPKDWKPASSVNVKNLINEKKSRLAAMTSQQYRKSLSEKTGATTFIKDKSPSDTTSSYSTPEDTDKSLSDAANTTDEMETANSPDASENKDKSVLSDASVSNEEIDKSVANSPDKDGEISVEATAEKVVSESNVFGSVSCENFEIDTSVGKKSVVEDNIGTDMGLTNGKKDTGVNVITEQVEKTSIVSQEYTEEIKEEQDSIEHKCKDSNLEKAVNANLTKEDASGNSPVVPDANIRAPSGNNELETDS